tara:strand:+ start:1505 stop:2449 length:945 start_codon:yes stop_codon:yes gene_type:complete
MELIQGFKLFKKTTIIYPDESVLSRIEDKFGKTIDEIKEHSSYRKLILGFVTNSSDVFNGESVSFSTKDGNKYSINFDENLIYNENDVKFKILSNEIKKNVRFISIRGIIATTENVENIKESSQKQKNASKPKSTEKKEVPVQKSKKRDCDEYKTSYNGFENGFWVCVKPGGFVLVYYKGQFVFKTPTKHVFIGESPKTPMTEFSGGYGSEWDGNSILLHIKDLDYVYIGSEVYKFTAEREIIEFLAPVGNNSVPYPHASDGKNIYFMLEGKIILNGVKELLKDNNPYPIYYKDEHTFEVVNMKNRKMIHEHFI